MTENSLPAAIEEKSGAVKKQTLRGRILEWLGYFAVFAALLFFFAPESWWQFGVSPIEQRKNTANFTLAEIGGGEWNFAAQRGKVVVVNYWATWCPPCREEIPHLVDISREYGGRGVEVIGLTIDARESLQTINNYAQNLNINYAVGLPESVVGPTMTRERGGVIPQTYIITRDGRILTRFVGFDPARSAPQLRAAVERAVNTP